MAHTCVATVENKTVVKKKKRLKGGSRRSPWGEGDDVKIARWITDVTKLANAYVKNIIQCVSCRSKNNTLLSKGKQPFRSVLVCIVNTAQKVLWKKWYMVMGHDHSVQPFLVFSSSMKGLQSVKYCYVLSNGMVKKR